MLETEKAGPTRSRPSAFRAESRTAQSLIVASGGRLMIKPTLIMWWK